MISMESRKLIRREDRNTNSRDERGSTTAGIIDVKKITKLYYRQH